MIAPMPPKIDHTPPNGWRWQHGSIPDTSDGGKRVPDNVAALAARGKIGHAEVLSADRWYRDYTLGLRGAFDAAPGKGAGGGDAHTAMFARSKAKAAYNAALAAVGHQGDAILRLFVADGLTFEVIGGAVRLDRKATVGAVVTVLRRLTEHYADSVVTGPTGGITRRADFSA